MEPVLFVFAAHPQVLGKAQHTNNVVGCDVFRTGLFSSMLAAMANTLGSDTTSVSSTTGSLNIVLFLLYMMLAHVPCTMQRVRITCLYCKMAMEFQVVALYAFTNHFSDPDGPGSRSYVTRSHWCSTKTPASLSAVSLCAALQALVCNGKHCDLHLAHQPIQYEFCEIKGCVLSAVSSLV